MQGENTIVIECGLNVIHDIFFTYFGKYMFKVMPATPFISYTHYFKGVYNFIKNVKDISNRNKLLIQHKILNKIKTVLYVFTHNFW